MTLKQRLIYSQKKNIACLSAAGFMTAVACQETSVVLHCPEESVINIQSAFFGRRSDEICPHLEGSGGDASQSIQLYFSAFDSFWSSWIHKYLQDNHWSVGSCTVEGVLPIYRKICDHRRFCFAYAHAEVDPCPTVSKYLEIVYSCEQKGELFFFFFFFVSVWLGYPWISVITAEGFVVSFGCSQCACRAWVSRTGTSPTSSYLPPPPLVYLLPKKLVWTETPAGCLRGLVSANRRGYPRLKCFNLYLICILLCSSDLKLDPGRPGRVEKSNRNHNSGLSSQWPLAHQI